MGDFSGTITVDASSQALFDYLSDVGNLPQYFSRLTSAVPGDGEEIKTTAKMPDGPEVQGDAWFRVDAEAQRIEWGSEGPSDYHGRLEVSPSGESSAVEVHVHTTRVDDGDQVAQDSITETLGNIKRLVEERGAAG
jgi:uncharacterized membrane protein